MREIVQAIELANMAGGDSLDKHGRPIILHSLRVMFALHRDGHDAEGSIPAWAGEPAIVLSRAKR